MSFGNAYTVIDTRVRVFLHTQQLQFISFIRTVPFILSVSRHSTLLFRFSIYFRCQCSCESVDFSCVRWKCRTFTLIWSQCVQICVLRRTNWRQLKNETATDTKIILLCSLGCCFPIKFNASLDEKRH